MKEKIFFYIGEFKKAPLPIQNVVIKKGLLALAYIVVGACMISFIKAFAGFLPAIFILGYLMYDFLRLFHICCTEQYTYISGECLGVSEKRQFFSLKRENPKIELIRIRYDRSKELIIHIKNQREIEEIEEGKMVEIYIPDYAKVYQEGHRYKNSEYFCILISA